MEFLGRRDIYDLARPITFYRSPGCTAKLADNALAADIGYLANCFLHVFGVNEWSARLASALIGIISIPILYFSVRKIIGSGSALILSILLAVSPWHLFWSQNASFYSSLMLMHTLAAFAFFWSMERNWPGYLLLFYALFYFALSERMIAILWSPRALMISRVVNPFGKVG